MEDTQRFVELSRVWKLIHQRRNSTSSHSAKNSNSGTLLKVTLGSKVQSGVFEKRLNQTKLETLGKPLSLRQRLRSVKA